MEWLLHGSAYLKDITRKHRKKLFEWLDIHNTEDTRLERALDDWTGRRSKKTDIYPLQLIAWTKRGLYSLYDSPSGHGQDEVFRVGFIPQDTLNALQAGREPARPEATAQKRKRGRPSISNDQEQKVITLHRQKISIREIARYTELSTTTVQKILKRGRKSGLSDTVGDLTTSEQRESVSENKAINDTVENLSVSEARETVSEKN